MLDHRVFIGLHANPLEGRWWKMIDLIKVLDELEARDASEVHEAHVLTGSTLVFEPDHGIEYGVMDSEGFPRALGDQLSKYVEYERAAAALVLDDYPEDAFFAFVDYDSTCVDDLDQAADDFRDAYQGVWGSMVEYAENLVEELGYLGDAPDIIASYFDYERFARDLLMDDYWAVRTSTILPPYDVHDGYVYVFRSY